MLAGKPLGDGLLIPTVMLKHDEPKFLDDMTVAEVSQALNVPLHPVDGVDGLVQWFRKLRRV